MTTNEIRQKFLDFFKSKGHTIIESDSLVPKDDPTVLFTTAGMQQFKKQFLGYIDGYTRAATSQKCLRTDDLDKIGKTDVHHTFFEMLGNFSFGDYFKKEAIEWAWEFFTVELKIPKDKLWVSVYKDDDEAYNIWIKNIKLDPKRLIKLGDKSNFWPSEAKEKGPNGPCGPCSEIFFDYGVNPRCKNKKCNPDCDCGRFAEIWNLVFTQFERQEGGVLKPLPHKNIDTGMGLERLAAVIQGKKNNFETDIFAPILKKIDEEAKKQKMILDLHEKYIIADHSRAIVFAINDGVIPSNKERGFVIKRLITDLSDLILRRHGKPFLNQLVSPVIEAMRNPYPALELKEKDIVSYIEKTESDYEKVFQVRIPELTTLTKEALKLSDYKKWEELGKIAFNYRDTYGLTLTTILLTMSKAGLPEGKHIVVRKEFDSRMEEQKEKSRASSKMTGDVFGNTDMDLGAPKTEFLGYKTAQSTSTILQLFINNQKVNEASKGDRVKVLLDKTPFYAESGGQVGDSGYIISSKGKIRVEDTQKINDIYIHGGVIESGFIKVPDQVDAQIDLQRRLSIMRNHTATHLLQAALREILGSHVQQQGSLVAEDRLRFDFTHPKAISKEEIEKIEKRVNEFILNCDTVTREFLPIEKARESGALAFFAEKYGNIVRVVSMANYSKEFCGGTHLDYTGQIGLFKITSESAIAQGIRRLEAKTGTSALEYTKEQEQKIGKIAEIVKSTPSEVVERISTQTKRLKQLEKDLENLRFESIKGSIDQIIDKASTIKDTKLITHAFKDIEMEILRKVCDLIKQKIKSAIIVLGARSSENASILITVSDDLIQKGIKANDLIQEIAPLINGSGGGRPQMAQAGSKEVNRIEEAIEQANRLIKGKIQ